jgi:flagellar assembly protein FliH
MSKATAVKDGLTAWQRWELPSFDEKQSVDAPQNIPLPVEEHVAPPVILPTAAEIEQIHVKAQEEGYQAGYAAGYADGEQKKQRLTSLMDALDKELQQVDQQVAQDLLDLSLEIARQMLKQSLSVKPELLLSVVREAIGSLPHFNQHAHLIMHPDDAELVRDGMGELLTHMGWKIFEDAQMERGGCRVETSNSQIDATLATRWQRVVASIGKDSSWLES